MSYFWLHDRMWLLGGEPVVYHYFWKCYAQHKICNIWTNSTTAVVLSPLTFGHLPWTDSNREDVLGKENECHQVYCTLFNRRVFVFAVISKYCQKPNGGPSSTIAINCKRWHGIRVLSPGLLAYFVLANSMVTSWNIWPLYHGFLPQDFLALATSTPWFKPHFYKNSLIWLYVIINYSNYLMLHILQFGMIHQRAKTDTIKFIWVHTNGMFRVDV